MKRKLRKIDLEGQSEKVNLTGIYVESLPSIFALIFAIFGFILCLLDIKEDGMLLKIQVKSFTIDFLGTYIGALIIILMGVFFFLRPPNIKIK